MAMDIRVVGYQESALHPTCYIIQRIVDGGFPEVMVQQPRGCGLVLDLCQFSTIAAAERRVEIIEAGYPASLVELDNWAPWAEYSAQRLKLKELRHVEAQIGRCVGLIANAERSLESLRMEKLRLESPRGSW